MKLIKLSILFFALLLVQSSMAQNSKSETIQEFVKEIIAIETEDLHPGSPIQSFNTIAKEKAAETVDLTKENIKATLAKAKDYTHCVITVGKHTIVKITDLDNCKQSGAWSTCMPLGEGYVQKGSLISKSDYINNIIGIPDSQKRLLFLFK